MAKQPDGSKDVQGVRHDEEHDEELGQFMTTITTNSEAYFAVFKLLLKGYAEGKRKYPDRNRIKMLFDRLNLAHLPSPIRIMEFGGGTGETIAAIFHKLTELDKKSIVSVEEPQKDYLEKYKALIENTSNTCLDIAYPGPLQNYFGKSVEDLMSIGAYPQQLQDRVLAHHSLYHVVNYFDHTLDPYKDLQQSVSAMYAVLKPGGEMTIVLAWRDIYSRVGLRCFEVIYPNMVENFKRGNEAYRSVLSNGGIVDILNAWYPKFTATMCQDEVGVPLVLSSIAEVGAVVSVACMNGFPGDQSPFDQRILQVCTDFVSKYGSELGVSRDNHGNWSFVEKTNYFTIKKVEKV